MSSATTSATSASTTSSPRRWSRSWRASVRSAARLKKAPRLERGPAGGKRHAFRPPAAGGRPAHRLGPGDRLRARAGDHRREPRSHAARRLVLDHVGSAPVAAGAAADLRPGVPDLLARPQAHREDDADAAAAGLRPGAKTRAATEPAPDRRVADPSAHVARDGSPAPGPRSVSHYLL